MSYQRDSTGEIFSMGLELLRGPTSKIDDLRRKPS